MPKIAHFGCASVVSIASVVEDEEIRNAVNLSDFIREETLKRCMAIPSYMYKCLEWKNRYYDVIRRRVIAEVGGLE